MTTKTVPKPAPPKPWVSGFCNPANPPDSHGRCHGSYEGRPWRCSCHAVDRLLAHVHGIHVSADAVLTYDLDGIGWEDTARVAAEVKSAVEALFAAAEFLAKHAANQWPSAWKDAQHIEGVGTVRPYRSSNTKWDDGEVVEALVEKRMAATGGEIPDPMTVVGWLLDAGKVDYWRTGKLKELGLEPDDYRHTTYGTVRLGIKNDRMVGDTTRDDS
jgi:hypothetical protein